MGGATSVADAIFQDGRMSGFSFRRWRRCAKTETAKVSFNACNHAPNVLPISFYLEWGMQVFFISRLIHFLQKLCFQTEIQLVINILCK